MKRWQFGEAKRRLSELVRRARRDGPQAITLGGRDAVVVLSPQSYRRLTRPKVGLVEFVRKSPLAWLTLDLSRSRDDGCRTRVNRSPAD